MQRWSCAHKGNHIVFLCWYGLDHRHDDVLAYIVRVQNIYRFFGASKLLMNLSKAQLYEANICDTHTFTFYINLKNKKVFGDSHNVLTLEWEMLQKILSYMCMSERYRMIALVLWHIYLRNKKMTKNTIVRYVVVSVTARAIIIIVVVNPL